MPAPPPDRLDLIEAQIAELRELLDPQALRDRMEYTWNPRGTADELRVISTTGAKLPLIRKTIQFLGGVTDDPAGDRYVVAGGAGAATYHFSDDTTVADDEQVKFPAQTDPTIRRATLQTSTAVMTGNVRKLLLSVSEADPTATPRVFLEFSNGDTGDTQQPRTVTLRTISSSTNHTSCELSSNPNTGTTQSNIATLGTVRQMGGGSGIASSRIMTQTTTYQAAVRAHCTELGSPGIATADVSFDGFGTNPWRILGSDLTSNWMRQAATTAASTPVNRVIRGPFTGAVTALAAGGTQAITLTNARNGSDYVVIGGPNGAAGSELLQWSWVNAAGANDVTVNVSNTDPSNALTATMRFFVISLT